MSAETAALTAALDGDIDGLSNVLGEFLPGELLELVKACWLLGQFATFTAMTASEADGGQNLRRLLAYTDPLLLALSGQWPE